MKSCHFTIFLPHYPANHCLIIGGYQHYSCVSSPTIHAKLSSSSQSGSMDGWIRRETGQLSPLLYNVHWLGLPQFRLQLRGQFLAIQSYWNPHLGGSYWNFHWLPASMLLLYAHWKASHIPRRSIQKMASGLHIFQLLDGKIMHDWLMLNQASKIRKPSFTCPIVWWLIWWSNFHWINIWLVNLVTGPHDRAEFQLKWWLDSARHQSLPIELPWFVFVAWLPILLRKMTFVPCWTPPVAFALAVEGEFHAALFGGGLFRGQAKALYDWPQLAYRYL